MTDLYRASSRYHQSPITIASFAALHTSGIYSVNGLSPWDAGQTPVDGVRRDQVLGSPFPSFGKLAPADRLAFAVASLALSSRPDLCGEETGIALGIPFGSLSADLRFAASLAGTPSPALFSATLPSSPLSEPAIHFGLKGPNRVVSGDNAPGLAALDLAVRALRLGKARRMLVLSISALEAADRASPLLHRPAPPNSAFALLLTNRNTGEEFRTVDLDQCAPGSTPGDDEVYFLEVTRLLIQRRCGCAQPASAKADHGRSH